LRIFASPVQRSVVSDLHKDGAGNRHEDRQDRPTTNFVPELDHAERTRCGGKDLE
jgi:hypothetical protein